MTRAVLDTNVIVSAYLWGGVPRELIAAAIEAGVVLLSSDPILAELGNALRKPKLQKLVLQTGKTPDELVAKYTQLVTVFEPAEIPAPAVRDVDDVKVLAAAIGGKATHIVTGDGDLLTLGDYEGIHIVTIRTFLDYISYI